MSVNYWHINSSNVITRSKDKHYTLIQFCIFLCCRFVFILFVFALLLLIVLRGFLPCETLFNFSEHSAVCTKLIVIINEANCMKENKGSLIQASSLVSKTHTHIVAVSVLCSAGWTFSTPFCFTLMRVPSPHNTTEGTEDKASLEQEKTGKVREEEERSSPCKYFPCL